MPKYRIYLSESRQIDLDAAEHHMTVGDKAQITRVDFLNETGHTVASFSTPALQGFTQIDNLIAQKGG